MIMLSSHKYRLTKKSSAARQTLQKVQEAEGLPFRKLIQSNFTRWGSVYRMLDRNLKNKKPILTIVAEKGEVCVYYY
jgi:hypothetical protein